MITAAVGAILLEKLIAEAMVIHKLELGLAAPAIAHGGRQNCLISLFAGGITYIVYTQCAVTIC